MEARLMNPVVEPAKKTKSLEESFEVLRRLRGSLPQRPQPTHEERFENLKEFAWEKFKLRLVEKKK